MDETHEAARAPRQRTVNVCAYGDTADEIELAALDKARDFFGTDVQLEIVRDYAVIEVQSHRREVAGGKKYEAPGGVIVHAVD